jgi:hypothetical protein
MGSLLATAAAASPFTQTQQPPFGPAPDPLSDADLPLGYVTPQQFGAKGDGVADDTAALQAAINTAFVVCLNSAGSEVPALSGQKILFIPAGVYNISSPLLLRGTYGATMMGAGRFAAHIKNTAGGHVIQTNGCAFSLFKDMFLNTSGGGVCFDLDWDGHTYISLQSNTFENMFFQSGAYGLRIGYSGFQGDTILISNCFFGNQTVAGLYTANYNALACTVVGGDFQGCNIGIWVYRGSVQSVLGSNFEQSAAWDIKVDSSANDTMMIAGCRTESVNFANIGYQAFTVSSCNQYSNTPGVFIKTVAGALSSAITIESCISVLGQLHIPGSFGGTVANCQIGRDDWFSSDSRFRFFNMCVGTTILGQGSGTKKQLDYGYVGLEGDLGVIHYLNPGLGTLTDAATIATDASLSINNPHPGRYMAYSGANVFTVTLVGNRTLANPTNLTPGVTYSWVITQGAGGNHTLDFGDMFKFPGGTPTLSVAAAAVDIITAIYDGTTLWAQVTKAYA